LQARMQIDAKWLSPTDDELVELSLTGDGDAFEQLVRRYSKRMLDIAGSFFRQRDMREDVVQEAFAKAYFSLNTYHKGERFDRWLARITVNACYDQLRRMKRRPEYVFSEMTEDEATWLEEVTCGYATELHVDKERKEAAKELADMLLASLSADDRLVIILLEREELSVAEIAELTGWSKAKVKIKAFRARQAMRRALDRMTAQAERLRRKARGGKK